MAAPGFPDGAVNIESADQAVALDVGAGVGPPHRVGQEGQHPLRPPVVDQQPSPQVAGRGPGSGPAVVQQQRGVLAHPLQPHQHPLDPLHELPVHPDAGLGQHLGAPPTPARTDQCEQPGVGQTLGDHAARGQHQRHLVLPVADRGQRPVLHPAELRVVPRIDLVRHQLDELSRPRPGTPPRADDPAGRGQALRILGGRGRLGDRPAGAGPDPRRRNRLPALPRQGGPRRRLPRRQLARAAAGGRSRSGGAP